MSKKSKVLKFLNNKSSRTQWTYRTAINKYEKFHGTSIDEMVCKALEEQGKVAPHMLSIIDDLEDFQQSLIDENLCYGSITGYMSKIKTIYKRNRVEIPYIESVNAKQTRRREYIEYKDVLTKDELRLALSQLKPIPKARALAQIQGGLSNEECEHLTTRSFVDETRKYHQCDDDIKALEWLADENHPIIWVTKMIRRKTGKPYYILLGAEAVNSIASAKLYELRLPKNKGALPDKLLNMNKNAYMRLLRNINERLGFGLVAEESKLRSHNLRRFNATYIRGGVLTYEERSITNSQIDEMQGRGKTNVQDTYIKTNPLEQKLIYAKVMNNVSLYHQYDYEIMDGDVRIFLVDPETENKKLKQEVKKLSSELKEKQRNSEKLNALKEELGEDTFKELVLGILNAE